MVWQVRVLANKVGDLTWSLGSLVAGGSQSCPLTPVRVWRHVYYLIA